MCALEVRTRYDKKKYARDPIQYKYRYSLERKIYLECVCSLPAFYIIKIYQSVHNYLRNKYNW